jgi:hypothetical protein
MILGIFKKNGSNKLIPKVIAIKLNFHISQIYSFFFSLFSSLQIAFEKLDNFSLRLRIEFFLYKEKLVKLEVPDEGNS